MLRESKSRVTRVKKKKKKKKRDIFPLRLKSSMPTVLPASQRKKERESERAYERLGKYKDKVEGEQKMRKM